jgi:hypothetical protein
VCGCTPVSLATACAGKNCGTVGNGCGGTYNCGACPLPQTCGGGGVANLCGCTPTTSCTTICGQQCSGTKGTDSCGNTCNCGFNCGSLGTGCACSSVSNTCYDPGPDCCNGYSDCPSQGCTNACGVSQTCGFDCTPPGFCHDCGQYNCC